MLCSTLQAGSLQYSVEPRALSVAQCISPFSSSSSLLRGCRLGVLIACVRLVLRAAPFDLCRIPGPSSSDCHACHKTQARVRRLLTSEGSERRFCALVEASRRCRHAVSAVHRWNAVGRGLDYVLQGLPLLLGPDRLPLASKTYYPTLMCLHACSTHSRKQYWQAASKHADSHIRLTDTGHILHRLDDSFMAKAGI
jgi:hypothetical protein